MGRCSIPTSFGAAGFALTTGDVALNTVLDALEQKGVVKTLAEPNLIALSGDTASFLAGGEFPVPVGQDEGEFGTPTSRSSSSRSASACRSRRR